MMTDREQEIQFHAVLTSALDEPLYIRAEGTVPVHIAQESAWALELVCKL
jgi:hypothetical protein